MLAMMRPSENVMMNTQTSGFNSKVSTARGTSNIDRVDELPKRGPSPLVHKNTFSGTMHPGDSQSGFFPGQKTQIKRRIPHAVSANNSGDEMAVTAQDHMF